MNKTSSVLILSLSAMTLTGLAANPDLSKLPPASKQPGVTYAKDIKPLFETSCVRCHGAERPKGGLRLDSLEAVLKGGKEGKVITPGHSDQSQLVISVARIDDETAMPPKPRGNRPGGGKGPGAGRGPGGPGANAGTNQFQGRGPAGPPPKPLSAEEVALVRAWVDQGAK